MKKLLALILLATLCLSLVSCGGTTASTKKPETTLSVANPVTIDNYAKFSLFKVTAASKITASLGDDIYYEADAGEIYVDIVLDFTNLSTKNMSSEDVLVAVANSENGQQYKANLFAVETNDAHYLSQYETITPLSTVRLHCAIRVPESESKLTLKFKVQDNVYVIPYTVGEILNSAQPITVGQTIEAENFATMTFKGIEFTDDLRPTDTSGSYSHYDIDNPANTYLVVKFDITNHTSNEKDIDTFAFPKAVFMNKYTYTGFTVVEDEDQKGFDAYEDIAPLSTRHFYCLIEIPKTVMNADLSITISFNNQEFVYTNK